MSRMAFVLALLLAPLCGRAWAEPASMDAVAIQGLLALARLDGWLLYDYRGQNPVARDLAQPKGDAMHRWFYLIPSRGEPVALLHRADAPRLAVLPGRRMVYEGYRELEASLRELLKGRKRVAMEYSPSAALPDLSRVDAGTVEQVRGLGVEVVPSADLMQAMRARWSKEARASHYVAAHHLVQVKDDALAFLAQEIRAGRTVTERDVAQRVLTQYAMRDLETEAPPVIASGPSTGTPHHVPAQATSRVIQEGDLVLVSLAAKQAGSPGAVHASLTWMAFVGNAVPARLSKLFALVAKARDETVAFVNERIRSRRPVRGWEADKIARDIIARGGHERDFRVGTGHSLGTRLVGDGAHLDGFETRDERVLLQGMGFTVSPAIFLEGELGLRTEVNCYVSPTGIETTIPAQRAIVPLLAPAPSELE
ncbi:MAG: aminopeptidase P family protein [Deltaproteobacteria bacterium]|nr:aminopeptidase P family protein [Deltaproteobacteria bacterium]